LGVSKSTLLRWEKEGVLPPTERDLSSQRNTRVYTQEHIDVIVAKQRQRIGREYERTSADADRHVTEESDEASGQASTARGTLQALLEAHSLRKFIAGNRLGLSELRHYDYVSPDTIETLLRIALEECEPSDAVFADIIEVIYGKTRGARNM
jgi:DNA-binding transcriptional MerR regulator